MLGTLKLMRFYNIAICHLKHTTVHHLSNKGEIPKHQPRLETRSLHKIKFTNLVNVSRDPEDRTLRRINLLRLNKRKEMSIFKDEFLTHKIVSVRLCGMLVIKLTNDYSLLLI